jgi:hypothetical protein
METDKSFTGTTHSGNPLPLSKIWDEEPLYSIRDVRMWEQYVSIPSKLKSKYSRDRTLYWGHRYYGREVVNKAPDERTLKEDTARLWFAFSVSLLSKILYTHFPGIRAYAGPVLCMQIHQNCDTALDMQFGKTEHSWAHVLPVKLLSVMPCETDNERFFHVCSRRSMKGIVSEFLALVDILETHAGKGVFRLRVGIAEYSRKEGFVKELTEDPAIPSGLFLLELRRRLKYIPGKK